MTRAWPQVVREMQLHKYRLRLNRNAIANWYREHQSLAMAKKYTGKWRTASPTWNERIFPTLEHPLLQHCLRCVRFPPLRPSGFWLSTNPINQPGRFAEPVVGNAACR
jgi:hypothetical protein